MSKPVFFAILAGLVVSIVAFVTATVITEGAAAAQEERLRSAQESIDSQLEEIQEIIDRMKADRFDIPDF